VVDVHYVNLQYAFNYKLQYNIFNQNTGILLEWLAWFGFMVFNATFNNISVISWRLVLLVEETGGPGENNRPAASH
jgi:hypothetical protein